MPKGVYDRSLAKPRNSLLTLAEATRPTCPVCHASFKNRGGLAGHMWAKHKHLPPSPRSAAVSQFKCDLCGKQYDRSQDLGRHKRFSHGIKGRDSHPYKGKYQPCPQCGKKFKRLATHLVYAHKDGAQVFEDRLREIQEARAQGTTLTVPQPAPTNGKDNHEEEQREARQKRYLAGYAQGRVEALIEHIAAGGEISTGELARSISAVLSGKALR